MRSIVTAAVLIVGAVLASAPAEAAPLAIEVDDAQTVTITGSSDSLRSAIAELCQRADVKLVAYEAPDRPFSASYNRIPLSEALGRLLRSEIFLVGVRPGEHDSQVVTWLRVSGATGGVANAPALDGTGTAGAQPAAEGKGPNIDLGVAPLLIETALTSEDTFARNNARRTILEALRGDPAPLERFLGTDVGAVVDEISGYPHAAELLNSLQSVTTNAEQRTKIQTLLRSIRVRQDTDRRKPAESGG